ncbi:SMI1/KNR4 family protein [Micromonospora sp. RTP1Z1]|uniref:SMI1/KNR4 family protein n=1 Tax=Micromonospora sp. RTP1Z1 TaxID=2994043 RepID=UPI0029C857DB|nr:SMI1/KNR4 family protein [Micromonospora sp. RTP1Z1]
MSNPIVSVCRWSLWHRGAVNPAGWWQVLLSDDAYVLRPPSSVAVVSQVESLLGVGLPADLRAFYLATDGVFDKMGQWFVCWPLDEVVKRNQEAWAEEGAGRRQLLGFGDDGTGSPFCVSTSGSGHVFWDSIDAVAYPLATNLADFWRGWHAGTLKT